MQSGRRGNLPYVIARNGCPKIDCHCEERSDEAISPICHCEERSDEAISPVRPQPERLLRPSAEGLAMTREDRCLLPHGCCLATSHESRCNRGDVAISNRLVT